MAAQASHVVYADKALKTILKGRRVNEKEYFLGTLFPDIRYLVKIDRNLTHFNTITANDLSKARNDFELGMLVHSLVDVERDLLINNSGIYKKLPPQIGIYTFVKLIEEKYAYPVYREWGNITNYLNDILFYEVNFVDKALVCQWHLILQKYFNKPPTKNSIFKFAEAINIEKETTTLYAEYSHFANSFFLIGALKSIYPSLFEYKPILPK